VQALQAWNFTLLIAQRLVLSAVFQRVNCWAVPEACKRCGKPGRCGLLRNGLAWRDCNRQTRYAKRAFGCGREPKTRRQRRRCLQRSLMQRDAAEAARFTQRMRSGWLAWTALLFRAGCSRSQALGTWHLAFGNQHTALCIQHLAFGAIARYITREERVAGQIRRYPLKSLFQPIVQDSLHGTSLRDLRQRAAIR
jgi:hypothetical protein